MPSINKIHKKLKQFQKTMLKRKAFTLETSPKAQFLIPLILYIVIYILFMNYEYLSHYCKGIKPKSVHTYPVRNNRLYIEYFFQIGK